jgi:ribosome maturation protein Sdo1
LIWNSSTEIKKVGTYQLINLTVANGLLPEPRNGKRANLVDIIAYEDVYHDARKALK